MYSRCIIVRNRDSVIETLGLSFPGRSWQTNMRMLVDYGSYTFTVHETKLVKCS